MKLPAKISTLVLTASAAVMANLATVTVPPTMIHPADPVMGFGAMGKVEYTLSPESYDSVYVTFAIKPNTPGAAAIPLKSITGDTGVIRANIYTPTVAKTYTIFFEAQPTLTGGQYVAEIVATPAVSAVQTDITAKLAALTKSQKAGMAAGGGNGFVSAGAGGIVPQVFMADGPHGVRPPDGGQATCFPTDAALACTWDTSLAHIQGMAMGEEFRAYGFNCQLGPALNLVYHPQGGRASEYFSEDPYLSGHMAAADIRGIQSKGVMATVKHFACNNKEENRVVGENAAMSERSMQELYLANWKPCFDADCWGVMGAYNRVLGIPACESKYLQTDVLRTTWGYRGLLMTDWGVQMNQANASQWGVDIEMPSGAAYAGVMVGATDAVVNMHAAHIIYSHEMIGDMKPGYNPIAYAKNNAAHDSISRLIGTQAIILARNTDNILPIPKQGKKVAITGPFATQFRSGPGGSSYVTPWKSTHPSAGISNYVRTLAQSLGSGATSITTDLNAADYILVFVGANNETEGQDRTYLALQPGDGETAVQAALAATNGPNKTIVIYTGGSASTAGTWSSAQVKGLIFAFYPGQEQGYCIADILFGNVNPSGKLPITFPNDASQLPNFSLNNNSLVYPGADTAHGYFRVNKLNQKPLFPFGFGLSYTTYTYTNLQVSPKTITAGDRVFVRATVTNTGTVAGKEVVQLYLSMPQNAGLPVRVQDLRGFQKVALDPGASQTVTFELSKEDMQVFKPGAKDFDGTGAWTVLPGTYGVRVGTSSQLDMQPTVSGSFAVQ
jgi:beta-glucosidase